MGTAMRLLVSLLFLLCSGISLAQSPDCSWTDTTACLQQNRFVVSMTFDSAGAAFVPSSAGLPAGNAEPVFGGMNAAVFRFYDVDQVDAFVKVLNGCPINGRFWVFASGATDAATEITVTDTVTGDTVRYASDAGQPFSPVADTNAFATCDASATVPEGAGGFGIHDEDQRGTASCGFAFCLQNGRYGLDVAFESLTGDTGVATASGAVDHSGVGALFGPEGLDFLSSVLDGGPDNGAFWFATASDINFELTYTLTDTQTGRVNVYVDPLEQAGTILDRGQPLEASLQAVQGGDPVSFELLLTNTAPTERNFRATLPVPTGAVNPRYTCRAAGDAVCPNASGSGTFNQVGPISAGGGLTYTILFDRAASRGTTGIIQVEATVETEAHALSESQARVVSAGEAPVALPVPADSLLMLGLLAVLLLIAGLVQRCR